MYDWFSSYLFFRERQRELLRWADQQRLLAALRERPRASKPKGKLRTPDLRHQRGAGLAFGGPR